MTLLDRPTGWTAFRHRDFALFFAIRILSASAAQMQAVAVGWLIYDVTHSALALGLIGLASFLPAVGLALVTGHVADRYDRRGILVRLLPLTALARPGWSPCVWHGMPAVWPIYLLVVRLRRRAAPSPIPAGQALMPNLVPRKTSPMRSPGTRRPCRRRRSSARRSAACSTPSAPPVVFGTVTVCFADRAPC